MIRFTHLELQTGDTDLANAGMLLDLGVPEVQKAQLGIDTGSWKNDSGNLANGGGGPPTDLAGVRPVPRPPGSWKGRLTGAAAGLAPTGAIGRPSVRVYFYSPVIRVMPQIKIAFSPNVEELLALAEIIYQKHQALKICGQVDAKQVTRNVLIVSDTAQWKAT